MGRKFTAKITTDQLADKIVRALEQRSDYDQEEMADLIGSKIGATGVKLVRLLNKGYSLRSVLKTLAPAIEEDLKKVEFDTENLEFEEGEGYSRGKTGFRTLPNGLTILGVTAGGDWEAPIYFILYSDGKELRGYIPTDGNIWNTDTNQAYGNADSNVDERNCQKRFGVKDPLTVSMNQDKIDADIQSRITFGEEELKEPKMAKVRQPKIKGELAFTVTELIGRCSGSAKSDAKSLYRILKEICIERNDFENASVFRDKERQAK